MVSSLGSRLVAVVAVVAVVAALIAFYVSTLLSEPPTVSASEGSSRVVHV